MRSRVRVLVAGVSTRAAAESAARAGFDVTSIDAFGDLDQHPAVHGLSVPRDFGVRMSATAAVRASRSIACDAVVYLSNFDNHPHAVGRLCSGRALWGNVPSVLRRVRDPHLLAEAIRRRGLPALDVLAAPGRSSTADHWLMKPRASGGGHGVKPWKAGKRLSRGSYLQKYVEGVPGSIVFVAAAGRAVPLGLSWQLVGHAAFGTSGYRYCGNILSSAGDPVFARDDALFDAACGLADVVSEEFGLIGVNGIDFIARDGVPWAIEVNPRWSASMELVERAYGLSVFQLHAQACASGRRPDFQLREARRGVRASGKAVVFARTDVVCSDTESWLADPDVRDVPRRGEAIPAGRPVCTVFAEGIDAAECYRRLVQRAEWVYEQIEQ